MHTKAKGFFV